MKAVFIGEAFGEKEAELNHAFVGPTGQELWRILGDAGFPCSHLPYNFTSPYSMTRRWAEFPYPLLNVFNARPENNAVTLFYGRASGLVDKTLPVRKSGSSNLYVLQEHAHHVHTLRERLVQLKPNLIVALGNTALWSLGLPPTISTLRGSVAETPYGKVLPTWHPAAVLRQWSLRLQTIIDLIKAKREMEFPELRTKPRFILTEPSLDDLYTWWEKWGTSAPLLAIDIETARGQQITEVSIAASPTQALHLPFFFEEKGRFTNYWKTLEDEFEAWKFLKMVCESDIPKMGHNLVQYDAYMLAHIMKIPIRNITADTMTLAHAWQPELPKRLGFLGSIFLDQPAWKHIRKDAAKEVE